MPSSSSSSAPPGLALPPLTERHFVVGRLLGMGAFNAVYEASFDASAPAFARGSLSSLLASDPDAFDDLLELSGLPRNYALKKPRRCPPVLVRKRRQQRRNKASRRRKSSGGGGGEASEEDEDEDEAELLRLAAVADLEREIDVLRGLDHRNVVKLHWVLPPGKKGEGRKLVLDRLGCTLSEKLSQWRRDARRRGGEGARGAEKTKRRSSLGAKMIRRRSALGSSACRSDDADEAAAFLSERLGAALDVAEGLRYLHSRGIIHRDLKPDNIGFDESTGVAKIFDFGLAKRLVTEHPSPAAADEHGKGKSSSSSSSSLHRRLPKRQSGCVDTLRYMAPEVARSDDYALDADVYSFGMLLYEICALEQPYLDIGQKELSRKVHRMESGKNIDGEGGGSSSTMTRRMSWMGGVNIRRRRGSGDVTDKFHAERSAERGGAYRPKLPTSWPAGVRDVLSRCWSDAPEERPEWDEIIEVLRRVQLDMLGKEEPLLDQEDDEGSSGRSSRSVFGRR